MPVSRAALFAWHEREGAFERLAPPAVPVTVVERFGGIKDGARIVLKVRIGLASVRWELEHRDYREGEQFRDVQVSGPFARWEHLHRFEDGPDGTSILHDEIDYALPAGAVGDTIAGRYMADDLARLFRYRHAVTADDLARHAEFAGQPPMTVAITGASGLIGASLSAFLTTGGHTVRRIGRNRVRQESGEPETTRARPGGGSSAGDVSFDFQWDPANDLLDPDALDGVDAVVHLAGASISERWTEDHKRAIRESRVQGTSLLASALAALHRKPAVLVSASAIGWYGERGDEMLDESSAGGGNWLAGVARQWEHAADPARDAGIRVVHPRTGVVLSARGGALAKMLPIFKLGAGGRVGSGAQWLSWISLHDTVAAIAWMLQHERARGPMNLVSPGAVTNAYFTRVLAHVLHRPAIAVAPPFALSLAFGAEMTREVLVASQRVRPLALELAGFRFTHPSLEEALRFELGLLPA